jgi:hypothetical protein
MLSKRQISCLIGLTSAVITAVSSADTLRAQMELCGLNRDDTYRLACFDELFSRSDYVKQNPPPLITGHGDWIGVKNQVIKNQRTSALLLPAQGVSPNSLYLPGSHFKTASYIRIDCSRGHLGVYMHWPRDLGYRDIAFDLTFDNQRTQQETWRVALEGDFARPTTQSRRKAFINSLWNSNTLTVSIPRNGLTEQYDLRGFQGISKNMRDVCEWVDSM